MCHEHKLPAVIKVAEKFPHKRIVVIFAQVEYEQFIVGFLGTRGKRTVVFIFLFALFLLPVYVVNPLPKRSGSGRKGLGYIV